MMHAKQLKAELKLRAGEAGFDALAVARAARLDRHAEALHAWLRRDHHAAMAWMGRDANRRADPRSLLPDCRTVVALAASYWPGEAGADTPAGRGRVALYARGRDYHRVLGRALRALAAWIERETALPARACVDSWPVLERAWAERAGLGWIGKNSCVLTRELGSFTLLGEILAVAEIEPDAGPHEDLCGTCTTCIDACPTAAIVGPGEIDARRCISYWTIEHRGSIPEAQRAGIGAWLFGCDVCQDVCPWNRRFAREVGPERFGRRDDLRGLDAVELLGLDEATFRARYSGTPLMRAKWEGMRRNACIVLGNLGDPRARDALRRALVDRDPVVREHAAWALERLG
jgi:epoxyqueuosine reductase